MTSSSNNDTIFSPYLLSRFHQHLNHLNDMAFTHTKILQEIIEKRSNEPMTSSPHGSISSSPPSSIDSSLQQQLLQKQQKEQQQQRKRSYSCNDNQEMKNENHLNKRPRKQSKPQQLVNMDKSSNQPISSDVENDDHEHDDDDDDDDDDDEEIGEINDSIDKQNSHPILPSTVFQYPINNLPFLTYIQDFARTNNLPTSFSMGKFFENLQKELLTAAFETKRTTIPAPAPAPAPTFPPFYPQPVHHSHHPYFSQMLFNNSFANHFPPSTTLNRFGHTSDNSTYPYHISTPKKRRTKVTDTRLSPRIASKITPQTHLDDLSDDDNSSSHNSSDENPTKSEHQSIEYNGFQISNLI